MVTVEQIKAAIPHLTPSERDEIAKVLNECDDDEWDRQMKQDAASGKFGSVLKTIDQDIARELGRVVK